MEDNMYKTGTERLIERPVSQQKRQKELEARYIAERPILKQLLEYLDNRIGYFQSINSIKTTDDVEKFMCEVLANQRTVEILKKERSSITRLINMFDKKRK